MRRLIRRLACLPLLSTAACAADAITGPRPASGPAAEVATQTVPDAAREALAAFSAGIKPELRSEPLYVIDGVIATDPSVLQYLDRHDIASIEVIKGTSPALMGCKPPTGVVLITLERGSPSRRRLAASYRR